MQMTKHSVINLDTKNFPEIKAGQKIELETEHGQTFYKVETDDDETVIRSSSSQQTNTSALSVEEAAKIATNEVNGKITEIEKEYGTWQT